MSLEEVNRINRESKFLDALGIVRNRKFSYRNPPRKIRGAHTIQDDAEKVNPFRNSGMKMVNNNCVLCAIAYDMRRRNFDVQAKLSSEPVTTSTVKSIYGINVNDYRHNVSSNSYSGFERKMLNSFPKGSRGLLFLDGTTTRSGHALNFEIKKDRIVFIDGQSNNIYSLNELREYRRFSPKLVTAIKTDDVPINYSVLDQACSEIVPKRIKHFI